MNNGKKKALALAFLWMFGFSAVAQFTLVVDAIPSNTPAGDDIYVAGDFQGWDPGSAAHRLVYDSLSQSYSIALPITSGTIEFKFTRGDWTKVESDAEGNYIPNRVLSTSNGDSAMLQILAWEDLNSGGGGQSTAADNVTILSDSFYIPQLDRYRRVWIYLPPDYAASGDDYPVLYMHDGQNVFDANTSFVGEWKVDETLNALHGQGDRGIIVVAVDHGGTNRIGEYTPWSNPTYGGGDGALYVDFLVEELIPHINQNYRTLTEPKHTGIMGSSLGGLISTYAGAKYPDIFGRIGAFSPAYWINPECFDFVGEAEWPATSKVYQLVGSLEGATYVSQMFRMHDTLGGSGLSTGRVLSIEKSDGEHSEWFWAREFAAAYRWLFGEETSGYDEWAEADLKVSIFPNPVQKELKVRFKIKDTELVKMHLLGNSGSTIRLLYTDTLAAGRHTLSFDVEARNIPAGVYHFQLTVGGEHTFKQLVIK